MSTQNCVACKTETLVTSTEIKTGVCIACQKKTPDLLVKVESLTQQVKNLEEERTTLEGQVSRFKTFLTVEEEGKRAAERLSTVQAEEECPYSDGTPERVFWMDSFLVQKIRERDQENTVLRNWALQNLSTVKELADGYGQTEISQKIDTVITKLAEAHDG